MKRTIKLIYDITDLHGYVICFLSIVNIISMIINTNLNSIINAIVTILALLCYEIHRYLIYKGKAKSYANYSILAVLIAMSIVYTIYVFVFYKI